MNDLNDSIKRLIAGAKYDLYYGPHHTDGYPGFESAVELLRAWWQEQSDRSFRAKQVTFGRELAAYI